MIFEIKLALRYLSGKKLRTFLTTLSILFGVMIIFGLNGVIPSLQDSFRRSIMLSTGQVDFTVTNQTQGPFSEEVLDRLKEVKGLEGYTGILIRNIILPETLSIQSQAGKAISSLTLIGIDPVTYESVKRIDLTEGNAFSASDAWEAYISEGLAGNSGLRVGDSFRLPTSTGEKEIRIVGIYKQTTGFREREVYLPLRTVQNIFELPGQVNLMEMLFSPGTDQKVVKQEILATLGEGFQEGGQETGSELKAALDMGEQVFTLFGLIAITMGGFIIFITFRTIAVERRREIGLLRALGATRSRILRLLLWEGVIQGIAGTLLGMIAGFLFVKFLFLNIGPVVGELLKMEIGDPVFPLKSYLLSMLLGVGITIIGGILPAIGASRITPLEALRLSTLLSKRGEGKRRGWIGLLLLILGILGPLSGNLNLNTLGFFLFMMGLILVGPVFIKPLTEGYGRLIHLFFAREGHVAKGNMESHPHRAFMTAYTMMIGLALLISLGGMVTSIMTAMNSYLEKSMGSDYILAPQSLMLGGGNVGASPELTAKLKEIPGVAEVTGLRMSMARGKETNLQVIGIDPQVYPKVAGLEFTAGDPEQVFPLLQSGRNLIINGILASSQGVKVNDQLMLTTSEGVIPYRVVGIGMDFLNAKIATAYISQENLARDFHESTDLLLLINKEKGADGAVVEKAIRDAIKGYPTFTLSSMTEYKGKLREQINLSMSFYYVLLFVITIPSLIGLVNTLAIAVMERTREIGVLRAIGATRRQIKRIILAESLLLTGVGTLFSLLTGTWLGYLFVAATNVMGFKVDYSFPLLGILVGIATGILFGLIGALIPVRHAEKVNIIQALKYE